MVQRVPHVQFRLADPLSFVRLCPILKKRSRFRIILVPNLAWVKFGFRRHVLAPVTFYRNDSLTMASLDWYAAALLPVHQALLPFENR
jgi:hypothetical protein